MISSRLKVALLPDFPMEVVLDGSDFATRVPEPILENEA